MEFTLCVGVGQGSGGGKARALWHNPNWGNPQVYRRHPLCSAGAISHVRAVGALLGTLLPEFPGPGLEFLSSSGLPPSSISLPPFLLLKPLS